MVKERKTLRTVWLLVISLVLLATVSGPTQASHAHWAHNVSVHSVADYEWVCVDTKQSTASWWTTLSKVRDTLLYDNPTNRWDSLAYDSGNNGYKIYFAFETLNHCSDSPNLSSMRMRVYVKDDTTSPCGGTACVAHYGQIDGGHNYTYEIVTLATRHVTGTTALHHHVINHEFGHTLGLSDPPDRSGTNCGTSVMHSKYYGCSTDHEFPQSSDMSSATTIANGQ